MQNESLLDQKKVEVPPPQTFLIHKKPSPPVPVSSTPLQSSSHPSRTHGHSTHAATQGALPKKATHFSTKTLYEDPAGAESQKEEKEVEEEGEQHPFVGAPLMATMSSMQLVGAKKGKGKGKDVDGEVSLSGPSSYSLLTPGTPPSNGKKKYLKKGIHLHY